MAGFGSGAWMVPVQRAELVTQDMDVLADMIREQYFEHTTSFRCPDPAKVDGRMRIAEVTGLNTALVRYTGFQYSAEVEPVDLPMIIVCTQGSASIATAHEELRVAPGEAFLIPANRPVTCTDAHGGYITLQVPWGAMRSLAEEANGVPIAELQFEAVAPVSSAAQRVLVRTAEFISNQLVTSGATEFYALIVPELTRLVAAAFLETFPNTTMTVDHVREPGWVAPVNVRRAAGFISAYADQPVTLDQIAAVAGVTGRALQYAFRRYYGTTPTGYLRRVRLERAHAQLRAAGPGDGVTVGAVARRCGWANAAHFATAYRQRFGVPPSDTLRS